MLESCFEFDWQCSKVPKFVKNEADLARCKEAFRSIYPFYKEAYKHLSTVSPIGDVWCVPNYTFMQFIDTTQIVDNVLIKAPDLDIKFIATNTGSDLKGPRNPERGLVRYQLMECLFRIAEEKYVKSQTAPDYTGAISMLLDNHCVPYFKKYDSQKWR
jgi:hypothetical protein